MDVGADGWLFGASLNLLSPGVKSVCRVASQYVPMFLGMSGDLDSSAFDVFQHDHHLVAVDSGDLWQFL